MEIGKVDEAITLFNKVVGMGKSRPEVYNYLGLAYNRKGELETAVGAYSHEFEYPVEKGEGLLVYAWIDTDEDGVLCTPTVRTDRAGLTELEGFTTGEVTADVELDTPCAGPEWFYPPAE